MSSNFNATLYQKNLDNFDLLQGKLSKIEASTMHGQLPLVWDHAKGEEVYDEYGNVYTDFTSGIFVANAGHSHPKVVESIVEATTKGVLHTYTYLNKYRVSYLEYLLKVTPPNFEKAFLTSAGSEATEAGLKLMRLGGIKKNKRRNGVICFQGAWHGRTMGAQGMSGNEEQKEWFGFRDPNIHFLPFPYPWLEKYNTDPGGEFLKDLNELCIKENIELDKDIAGFMIETFQGYGAIFYPTEYIQALDKVAKDNDIFMCFDEMQSGFGRTGKMFGYEHYNVIPDIICCGKGISSSLPLSAILTTAELIDLPGAGNMSSTHSGNPIACAAAETSLRVIIDEGLIENSQKMGDVLLNELEKLKNKYHNIISMVCGKGLLAAVHFGSPGEKLGVEIANKLCFACLSKGVLLVKTNRETIKFGPPLSMKEEKIIGSFKIIDEELGKILSSLN